MIYIPPAFATSMTENQDIAGFGEWLKAARKERGLSLRALAELSGISHVSIDKAEKGGGMRRSTLDLVVNALAGPDADEETREALRHEALAASVGIEQIQRVPTDDAEFWDAYEGAPQEDRELAKQLLQRARDRERARTIGGTVAD